MNSKLVLVGALIGCHKPVGHHTLGRADVLKAHLQEQGCKEAPPLGSYGYWFECVRVLQPCGCNVRVTVRASDVDGSSTMLVDGVGAVLRGCAAETGFQEVNELLDPLFPLQYRGAIHAFIRIPGQPSDGKRNADSSVIQFAEFPGVSLSAKQRLDRKRAELTVLVDHTEPYQASEYVDDPGIPQGCQR